MAFDTNTTVWDFDFDIIPGIPSGTTYPFTLKFYLYRPSSASYYWNLTWNFTFTINGTVVKKTYKTPGRRDVSAKTWHQVCRFSHNITIPSYSYDNRKNIKVSCSFTSDGSPASGSGSKTITIPANANKLKTAATAQLKDNGNNTVEIILTPGTGGTNNNIASTWCKYKFDKDKSETTIYTSDRAIKIPEGATKLSVTEVASKGKLGDVAKGAAKDIKVNYYSRPKKPNDLRIHDNGDNTFKITATKGGRGSNNESKGVEIKYSIVSQDGPWNTYKEGKNVLFSSDSTIYARARTIGSYSKMGDSIYYSDWNTTNSSVTGHDKPNKPTIDIIDNHDNTFCFQVGMPKDSISNNDTSGVEIYYTINGKDPTLNSTKIFIEGSSGDPDKWSQNINITSLTDVKYFARTQGTDTSANGAYLFSDNTKTLSSSVLYYRTPEIQKPKITWKKKLTKKSTIQINQQIYIDNLTILKNCCIYVYRNNIQLTHLPLEPSDVTQQSDNDYLLQKDVILNTLTNLDGSIVKWKKDDQIYVRIEYTVTDGAGNNLVDNFNVPISDTHILESSGIMRVNQNDTWYEGQVWVNIGGIWKEATDAFVNVDNIWKESV